MWVLGHIGLESVACSPKPSVQSPNSRWVFVAELEAGGGLATLEGSLRRVGELSSSGAPTCWHGVPGPQLAGRGHRRQGTPFPSMTMKASMFLCCSDPNYHPKRTHHI